MMMPFERAVRVSSKDHGLLSRRLVAYNVRPSRQRSIDRAVSRGDDRLSQHSHGKVYE